MIKIKKTLLRFLFDAFGKMSFSIYVCGLKKWQDLRSRIRTGIN
jgi:hypothetical protein